MDSIDDITPQEWDNLKSEWKNTAATAAKNVSPIKEEPTNYQPVKKFKLPIDAKTRKTIPAYTGFVKYFPRAITEVSRVSMIGGIQHGQTPQTLHWDRAKSGDELDAMMRHILDEDWAQVAWRAMANLEKFLEREEQD